MLGNNEKSSQGSSVMTNKPWAVNCIGSTISLPIAPVVLEDRSGMPDGTYPISQEQLNASYNWKFSDWYVAFSKLKHSDAKKVHSFSDYPYIYFYFFHFFL